LLNKHGVAAVYGVEKKTHDGECYCKLLIVYEDEVLDSPPADIC